MTENYLFKSERLGFRTWKKEDLLPLAEIFGDEQVMRFFPSIQDEKQTAFFIEKNQVSYEEKGYCYYAVEHLSNNELLGFIGIFDQAFESKFTPCIDIGWRLKASAWQQGYASEGASACLEHAFNRLGLDQIRAICPLVNRPSERVMQKIGMKKIGVFKHPYLKGFEQIEDCVVYEIKKEDL